MNFAKLQNSINFRQSACGSESNQYFRAKLAAQRSGKLNYENFNNESTIIYEDLN